MTITFNDVEYKLHSVVVRSRIDDFESHLEEINASTEAFNAFLYFLYTDSFYNINEGLEDELSHIIDIFDMEWRDKAIEILYSLNYSSRVQLNILPKLCLEANSKQCEILLADTTLKADKSILARCEYFNALFRSGMNDNNRMTCISLAHFRKN